MRKPRLDTPRFSIGDRIAIQPAIWTSHAGKIGTVVQIKSNVHSMTLDKYRVKLDTGTEELEFWDIQLRSLNAESRKAAIHTKSAVRR